MEAVITPYAGHAHRNRLCYLFIIFLTGCLIGWIYEEVFYWFTEGLLRNRGVLYGPWLPIYGFGTLIIYAMKPLKKYPPLLLVLCMAASGAIEYLVGRAYIYYFGLRLWDYRGLFWNLDGLVCLRSVAVFGCMGLAFHYWIEPAARKLYARAADKTIRITCLGLADLFLLDCVLSLLFRMPITY